MKYKDNKKYALFIGRWQPFHNGHKYLIDKAISDGKDVCVAIRQTELSQKNPYTVEQRIEIIRKVYGDKVKVISIPDIESINIGRNVGYDINRIDPPSTILEISGTNVRNKKENRVPNEVTEYIKSLRTTIWFTGLPCSGKTTLAKKLKEELDNRGYSTVHLDGDDIRGKLNEDLGFSYKDRRENLRRVAHVARLFNENGNLVVSSFISPTNELRSMVRGIIENISLVYVKCSLETCEKRDEKEMYKKARKGKIKNFTGVSDLFEEPKADVIVDTEHNDVKTCVGKILNELDL